MRHRRLRLMINIKEIVVGAFEVNCWVLWGSDCRAVVVDPGADADRIQSFLSANNLSVAAYMLTHGHIDHISGLTDMLAAHPAAVGISIEDGEWAFDEEHQMLPFCAPFYTVTPRPAEIARHLADGGEWPDCGTTCHIISTPGHTPGSVCIYFESAGLLIAGDTLFQGSVGRTDLPGGDSRVLSESLIKLAALPDATRVFPGHGPATTIAREKRTNYFMQAACHGD